MYNGEWEGLKKEPGKLLSAETTKRGSDVMLVSIGNKFLDGAQV